MECCEELQVPMPHSAHSARRTFKLSHSNVTFSQRTPRSVYRQYESDSVNDCFNYTRINQRLNAFNDNNLFQSPFVTVSNLCARRAVLLPSALRPHKLLATLCDRIEHDAAQMVAFFEEASNFSHTVC